MTKESVVRQKKDKFKTSIDVTEDTEAMHWKRSSFEPRSDMMMRKKPLADSNAAAAVDDAAMPVADAAMLVADCHTGDCAVAVKQVGCSGLWEVHCPDDLAVCSTETPVVCMNHCSQYCHPSCRVDVVQLVKGREARDRPQAG